MFVILNFFWFLFIIGSIVFGIYTLNQTIVVGLNNKESDYKETNPKMYILFDRIRVFLKFIYLGIFVILALLLSFEWSGIFSVGFLLIDLLFFLIIFSIFSFSIYGIIKDKFLKNIVNFKDFNDALKSIGEITEAYTHKKYFTDVVVPYLVNQIRKAFGIKDIVTEPMKVNTKMTLLSSIMLEDENEKKRYINIPFSIDMSDLSKHVYILAPTGSGKTKSVIGPMIEQTINNGLGLVMVDPKGDASVMNAIAGLMREQNRIEKLKIVDLDENNVKISSTYNPIATCSPNVISLMINATLYDPGSTATYYIEKQKEFINSMMSWVNILVKTLAIAKKEMKLNFLDLYALVAYLPESIDLLLSKVSLPEDKDDIYVLWKEAIKKEAMNQKYIDALSGLRNHLAQYAFLKNASWLINDYNPDINIEQDLKQGNTLAFFLRSLSYVHEASKLGKIILMDIQAYAAKKQALSNKRSIPDLLFIDEASSILPDDFLKMFDMARESGIGIVVAHQDKSQFEEEFLKRMFNNTSTRVLLRAGDRETAEFFSDLVGKKKFYEYGTSVTTSAKMNGIGEYMKPKFSDSAHKGEDYVIRPEKLVNDMPIGTAFIHSIRSKGAFAFRGKTNYFASDYDNLKVSDLFRENPKINTWYQGGLNFLEYCRSNIKQEKTFVSNTKNEQKNEELDRNEQETTKQTQQAQKTQEYKKDDSAVFQTVAGG